MTANIDTPNSAAENGARMGHQSRGHIINWRALALWIFLAALPAAHAGFSTVVIDPGHGGIDRGGIPGQRVWEKTMTLDVARRLQAILRARGLHTVMTRNSDTFVSLPARVALANAQRHAVFLSIHFNAAPNSAGCGFETYFYTWQSAFLARSLYSKLIRAWPSMNRGVRVRGFFVIRKTRIPAVLVECGFLTNPRETALILHPEIRQRLASLLAQALLEKR